MCDVFSFAKQERASSCMNRWRKHGRARAVSSPLFVSSFVMEVQCVDRPGADYNTFLITLEENKILLNYPLDASNLSELTGINPQPDPPSQAPLGLPAAVADSASAAAADVVAAAAGSGSSKFALDVNYSIAQGRLESCEERVVFRTPNLDVDINSINLVLISNSDTMLGLPFLTEYMGYKGKIVAVEPAIEFAR